METGLLVLNKQSERFALACLDVSDLSQMSTYTIEKIRISGCLILSKSTLSRRRIPILPKTKARAMDTTVRCLRPFYVDGKLG